VSQFVNSNASAVEVDSAISIWHQAIDEARKRDAAEREAETDAKP
jgi:hypothetical protein